MRALAVLPQGLEALGAEELQLLGAKNVNQLRRSVSFTADPACLYKIYLRARLPFRILREIARFNCNSPNTLYHKIQTVFDWEKWLHPSLSFRVDVSGKNKGLNHTHYTALQVKNALVDLQRKMWGERSLINTQSPDLCLHLHLGEIDSILSLDGSQHSLHKRGYRSAMGVAPIKENLAAGLIKLSEWNNSTPLIDPMCGSGTLLIEAVSMAIDLAPGISRNLIVKKWADFNLKIWEEEKMKVLVKKYPQPSLAKVIGIEKNPEIALQAKANIKAAGLEKYITIINKDFDQINLPDSAGLIVCNPPYGKRTGQNEDLSILYKKLGCFLKQKASGWQFWLLCGDRSLSSFLKLKCSRRIPINNGGIDCRWLKYEIK
ncbi:class I SAM-dependent RNA methyltransferase [Prochlorococcus sp. MIT 1341]|uniref:THUMP domain-containing class I SAM-dependent RNA methyltransferase n=1 Tax=Prochlorococcus sp. MIT 1341 TaxID=3096221 RepID=UPI002A75ACD6|nr:class I SAM-dependent RNA methyltransferase [Prochlorococcus sp. MIT 1341]